MTVDLETARSFVGAHRRGVLVTTRRDGRPQLSNIMYVPGADGSVRISITGDRAKYHNLVRDPVASLHVTSDDFWSYVVVDARAEVSPVAADISDPTVDALVELYRELSGEHPDWDDYRRAMVRDRRAVVTLRPEHAYGLLTP